LAPFGISILLFSALQPACQGALTTEPANPNGGAGSGGNGTVSSDKSGIVLPDSGLAQLPAQIREGDLPTSTDHCGETRGTTRAISDVVLVLDMSGSMNRATSTGQTRYEAVTEALNKTLPATNDAINWGLMMYPARPENGLAFGSIAGMECTPGKIDVKIAPKNAEAVSKAYSDQHPEGYTPTAISVDNAVAYIKTINSVNGKYIVLATDGQPNCPSSGQALTADDDAAVASVVAAKAANIPTFVIGMNVVGDILADKNAPAVLNKMAEAGGMPSNDPTNKFYVANNASEMVIAMETIGRKLATCRYTLPSAPPVPNNVLVVFTDGAGQVTRQLPSDKTWGYTDKTHLTIQLYDQSCEHVRDGTYKEVQILFGCDKQLIP
jgi:hypothetical protein